MEKEKRHDRGHVSSQFPDIAPLNKSTQII
jgi:hypothetical protein